MVHLWVVERLDKIENEKSSCLSGGGNEDINIGLGFEGAQERFDFGSVVANARPVESANKSFVSTNSSS